MTALRCILLFNVFVICSFATTVTPLIGYMSWQSQNGTGTGYFEVGVDTNTPFSQVPDYVKLINISFEIDVQVSVGVINTQTVLLYRAANQSELAANPPPATTLLPYECSPTDCPSGVGAYFTQSFGPTTVSGNPVAAPTIIAARLTYTAVAQVNPGTHPYWSYNNPDTNQTSLFTPQIVAHTVSLLSAPNGSFLYNGTPSDYAYLTVGGDPVPEPSTVFLCGFGLAAVSVTRIRRAGKTRV